jgi:hypothetical protein
MLSEMILCCSFRAAIPEKNAVLGFFEGGPALLIPVFDGPFIPLSCSLDRLLPTPARLTQQSTHMIAVITDSKGLIDHLCHTACGPHLASQAVGFGSLGSQGGNLSFLFCG